MAYNSNTVNLQNPSERQAHKHTNTFKLLAHLATLKEFCLILAFRRSLANSGWSFVHINMTPWWYAVGGITPQQNPQLGIRWTFLLDTQQTERKRPFHFTQRNTNILSHATWINNTLSLRCRAMEKVPMCPWCASFYEKKWRNGENKKTLKARVKLWVQFTSYRVYFFVAKFFISCHLFVLRKSQK